MSLTSYPRLESCGRVMSVSRHAILNCLCFYRIYQVAPLNICGDIKPPMAKQLIVFLTFHLLEFFKMSRVLTTLTVSY